MTTLFFNYMKPIDWSGGLVMVIIIPTEVSPEIAILIMLPYFAATILTIVNTHKRLEKSKDNDSDNNSKDIISDNEND
jgi:hypothetical protein